MANALSLSPNHQPGANVTVRYSSCMGVMRVGNAMFEAPWERAVDYLVAHAPRIVPSSELADVVYGGHCSEAAIRVLILRARKHFRIESHHPFGYRISTQDAPKVLRCSKCGGRKVRYYDELVCYGCVGTGAVDLEVGRAPYAEGSRGGKLWTEEENEFLIAHYQTRGHAEIGEKLGRSTNAVRGQCDALGLDKPYVRRKPRETGLLP